MTMYPPMYPPRASRAGRGTAAHRFCLTTDNASWSDNRQRRTSVGATCPEGYSLPRTPRKKFDLNYLLWAACNPGARETVVVLGISWHPVSPYTHGIGASRNLFAPDCTGNGISRGPASPPHAPESVRHATVLQREWYIARHVLPLPLSRERYAMQPIESSESVATV